MKQVFAIALLGMYANAESEMVDLTRQNVFMTPDGYEFMCKGNAACEPGTYWNYLACDCFNMAQCRMACPEDQDLIPTERCTCAPREEIRALFPEWASAEDVSRSMVEGMEGGHQDDDKDDHRDHHSDDNSDHGHDDHSDREDRDHDGDKDSDDEKIDRFEDALKELERAADDLFNMDSASAVKGFGTIVAAVTVLNN